MFIPYFKTYSHSQLEELVKNDKGWFSFDDFAANPTKYESEEKLKEYNKDGSIDSMIEQIKGMKGCYIKFNDRFLYDSINIIIPNMTDKSFFTHDYMCIGLSKLKTKTYVLGGIGVASLFYLYKYKPFKNLPFLRF